jgi:Protein of unknown function (DUF1579)
MPSRLPLFAFVVILPAAAAAQPPSPSPVPAPTPCTAAEHRQLDFWMGEWDVRGVKQPQDALPSRSRIESIEGGCVISEQYTTPGGYSGRSLNAYHADRKQWEQFWVDNQGGIHHYVGQARDGNMHYEARGVQFAGMAAPGIVRMTFFRQGPDRVRQLGEQSMDGGATWSTMYDLTYTRSAPPGSAAR